MKVTKIGDRRWRSYWVSPGMLPVGNDSFVQVDEPVEIMREQEFCYEYPSLRMDAGWRWLKVDLKILKTAVTGEVEDEPETEGVTLRNQRSSEPATVSMSWFRRLFYRLPKATVEKL